MQMSLVMSDTRHQSTKCHALEKKNCMTFQLTHIYVFVACFENVLYGRQNMGKLGSHGETGNI